MSRFEVFVIPGSLLIFFGFIAFYILVSVLMKLNRRRGGAQTLGRRGSVAADLSEKGSREFQEVARGLEETTKRIEALETLLLEKNR